MALALVRGPSCSKPTGFAPYFRKACSETIGRQNGARIKNQLIRIVTFL